MTNGQHRDALHPICVVHPAARLCIGCGRSLDEIARWIDLTDRSATHHGAIAVTHAAIGADSHACGDAA